METMMTQRLHLEMDEQRLDEWVAWGLRELDHHLARHAHRQLARSASSRTTISAPRP
jgi:hypothetical protein